MWKGKRKERVIGELLLKWASDDLIPVFDSNNKTLSNSSVTSARPDFLFDCGAFAVVVEVSVALLGLFVTGPVSRLLT